MTRDESDAMHRLINKCDAYRRIARAILALIRKGQSTPGLHDTDVYRCKSRYDVAALGQLEAELERLEGGEG